MDINSADWQKVQDLFFGRFVRDKKKSSPKLNFLAGDRKNGYLYPGGESEGVDYEDTLFDASRSMIRFRKPQHLAKMIDKIVSEKVGVVHSAILIYDNSAGFYVLIDSRGAKGRRIPAGYIRLDAKGPIIEIFKDRKNAHFFENGILYAKNLRWLLESGQLLNKEVNFHNSLRTVLKEMELLDVEVCVPCFFKRELVGLLILGKKSSGRRFLNQELRLFATLANDAAMAVANARLIDSLRNRIDEVEHLFEREHQLFINTAAALAKAIDARDVYTHGHTERVSKFCKSIVDELDHVSEIRFDRRFKEKLYMTALLHDIGKIGIPDKILNKKKGLTTAERRIVEEHPKIGASILYPLRELSEVARCVRSHQEWYNGNGYPDGLRRDEIPLISRIVSVADTFDAITSDRPYRKRRGADDAVREIRGCSGTQFDPSLVKAFLSAYNNNKILI